jgi:hypothetical protein
LPLQPAATVLAVTLLIMQVLLMPMEDQFPEKGDFDLNDVVIKLNPSVETKTKHKRNDHFGICQW